MKRNISILLILTLLFSLAACGQKEPADATDSLQNGLTTKPRAVFMQTVQTHPKPFPPQSRI